MAEEIYHHLLRSAVAEGNLFNVRRLVIRKGLPLTCPDPTNGWPTLFYAIRYQQNDIVDFLLDSGHEHGGISRDFQLNTALIVAADYKNEVAFNTYLARYPATAMLANARGKTALAVAAERGCNDIVLTLLNRGAAVDAVDVDGCTPLHHAAAWGHLDTINILIERGADCLAMNVRGWSPYDYAYSMDVRDYMAECVHAIAENRPAVRNTGGGSRKNLRRTTSSGTGAMSTGGSVVLGSPLDNSFSASVIHSVGASPVLSSVPPIPQGTASSPMQGRPPIQQTAQGTQGQQQKKRPQGNNRIDLRTLF